MDKNTYNIKADKIQKLVNKKDYVTAAKIADTIDWKQIHSLRMLTTVATAYEKTRQYEAAMDILMMAYEEAPSGRRILYKLTENAIRAGALKDAEQFYKMYLEDAGDDNSRYILRYLLADAKGEPLDKKIAILETYKRKEFEEEWAYQLALLYRKADMREKCVSLCDEIILWFGVGPYVDKAMELKETYEPLTAEQQERRDHRDYYEENLRRVAKEMDDAQSVPEEELKAAVEPEEEAEEDSVPEIAIEAEEGEEELPQVSFTDDYVTGFDETAFEGEELPEEEPFHQEDSTPETAADMTREIPDSELTTPAEKVSHIPFPEADEEESVTGLDRDLHADEPNPYEDEPITDDPEVAQELMAVPVDEDEEREDMFLEEEEGESELHEPPYPRPNKVAPGVPRQEEKPEASDPEIPAAEIPDSEEPEQLVLSIEELAEEPDEPEPVAQRKQYQAPIYIPTRNNAERINIAVDALRKAYEAKGQTVSQVAKISGYRLNMKGLIKSLPNLKGKDLIIDRAGEINDDILEELLRVERDLEPEKYFVLLDTPEELAILQTRFAKAEKAMVALEDWRELRPFRRPAVEEPAEEPVVASEPEEPLPQIHITEETPVRPVRKVTPQAPEENPAPARVKTKRAPRAAEETPARPKKAGHREAEPGAPVPERRKTPLERAASDEETPISEEAFLAYVRQYAENIDCVLEDGALDAVEDEMDAMQEEGEPLTKKAAEELVEDAADEAEKHSLKGLFHSKYNKDGRLVLRERHFRY